MYLWGSETQEEDIWKNKDLIFQGNKRPIRRGGLTSFTYQEFFAINIKIEDESNVLEESIKRACNWICSIIVNKEARSNNEVKDILENEMIDKLPKSCLKLLYAYVPEPEKKNSQSHQIQ